MRIVIAGATVEDVFNISSSSSTCCVLPVGKLVIHQQMGLGTVSWEGLVCSSSGMMVLNPEPKSKNFLALVHRLSSCCRIKCKPMLTMSSADLLAL